MVSIKATVMVITLLAVCLLATHTDSFAVNHGCCRSYKGKPPFHVIRGYSVQTQKELCPINAIIFHTKNKKVCTDPALNWVMDYVNRLRNKAQMVHYKNTQM